MGGDRVLRLFVDWRPLWGVFGPLFVIFGHSEGHFGPLLHHVGPHISSLSCSFVLQLLHPVDRILIFGIGKQFADRHNRARHTAKSGDFAPTCQNRPKPWFPGPQISPLETSIGDFSTRFYPCGITLWELERDCSSIG